MKKRILITGASSGIGRAAALALAKPNHELILVARREEKLNEVVKACEEKGGYAEPYPFDLSRIDKLKPLAIRLMARDGFPVLINSAGIGVFAPFGDLVWDDFRNQINLNLMAPAKLIHECLPRMLDKGGGQIVNVLSMTCVHVLNGGGGYSTSKSALHMLGKIVSQEYRAKGIKLTSFMPGAVDTPIWDGSPMAERMREMIPTEHVAALIAQLVESPHSFNMDEVLMMPPKGVL